jgi:branched-chain amino acid transport system ATP-binding protein
MSLEVDDVTGGYGNIEVLHGISIRAEKSKITCIIGPNGAGKSTLLKTIFGFIRPRKGKVVLDGEEITGLKPHAILKRGISYVLQGRSVFPYLTVLENLEMGAYVRNDKKQVKTDIEAICNLFPVLNKKKSNPAGTLSGGEQRMLELGRSLLLNPKVVLLDEPSIGLAPKFSQIIYEEIKKMNETGISVVMVEQNVRKALSISDYGYLLELGKNSYEGPASDFLSGHEIMKLYLGD